jgi:outer membrane protein TolC
MRPAGSRGPARALVGVVAAAFACTTDHYSRDADREVGGILDEYNDRALSGRAKTVQMPEPEKPPAAPEPVPPGEVPPPTPRDVVPEPPAEPLKIDLAKSLSTALHLSRNFQAQRESLYLAGLGFTLTQFNYGPKFAAAVTALWGKGEGTPRTDSYGGSFGVSQLLPTNGTIALTSGLNRSVTVGSTAGVQDWSSNVGVALSQPLLRNAGYDQYRESLTQGERNMVYAVRSFELVREAFVIGIATDYFALVSRKKQLVILERQLTQAIIDQERTEALRDIDRKRDQDVILIKRTRLSVEQDVLNARTDYKRQIEQFLVDLGLDPKIPVEIIENEPEFEKVAFDPDSVVKVALANRLDVQTRRDQLEDSERQLALQRQSFLPDLNLVASTGLAGSANSLSKVAPDQWSRQAGLSLNIPLQQISERNAWRAAEISLDQQKRDWDQFLDDTRNGLESDLRSLKNLEDRIVLDEQSIDDEQKNVERLEVQQSNGDVSSRDLFESRQALVSGQNQLIADRASHFIARLNFFRNLGLLFVDDEGRWSIGHPVAEDRR